MKRNLLLLTHDAAEGGSPAPGPSQTPPPAAETVATGKRSEREIALETELQKERDTHATTAKEKKDRESRIAELEAELASLKAQPKPAEEKGGWGFFRE